MREGGTQQMIKNKAAVLVTVLIFSVIILGQIATYAVTPRYEASVTGSDEGLVYTVNTNGATEYTVLAFDNARPVDKLYIYYDERYAVHRTTHSSQQMAISHTIAELRIRGFTNTETVDARGLEHIISDEYEPASGGEVFAILMTSGVFPDTVYSDVKKDIFDWVDGGGSLYWFGATIGEKFAVGHTLKEASPSYQADIFGVSDCIMTEHMNNLRRSPDPLSEALKTDHSDATFGLNVDALRNIGLNVRSIGFEHSSAGGTYGSVALVEKGMGMICVMGWSSDALKSSMAQVISSGVSERSTLLVGPVHGSLVRSSATGTIDPWENDPGAVNVAVHIRMGEPYVVYARTFFQ